MIPTITPQQRDALYEQILDHLSGIGDVWLAVRAKDFDAADRIGREYSDDLRLLLDDLGLGEGSQKSVPLTTHPEVLRRVMKRLYASASSLRETEASEREAAEREERRNNLLAQTCREILEDLGSDP